MKVAITKPDEMAKVFTDYIESVQVSGDFEFAIPEIIPLVEGVSLENLKLSKRDMMLAVESTRQKCAAGPDGFS